MNLNNGASEAIEVSVPDFTDRQVIHVTGYPRSGSTWVARSLAQALDCPSLSWSDDRPTLMQDPVVAWVGRENREYVVRRSHTSLPFYHSHFGGLEGRFIIMPVRDPRDIAISCWQHWTFSKDPTGLEQCVRQLCGIDREGPLQPMIWGGYAKDRRQHPGRPGWAGFVDNWLDEGVPIIRYKDHLLQPEEELHRLLAELGFHISEQAIVEAVQANLFHSRPKDHLMRVGEAGQWRKGLGPDLVDMITACCGDVMARLGYE